MSSTRSQREEATRHEAELREWFVQAALEATRTGAAGCWYHVLDDVEGRHPGQTWALAIGWLRDEESPDGFAAYAGVVFQPTNSIMQCDLDVDWQMPILENGDVDDTETCIDGLSAAGLETTFEWLLDIAKSYGLAA